MNANDISFLGNTGLLNKISDITRVVDPLQKTITEYINNATFTGEIHCFDFWGKNSACDNCISMRAYNDNATYVKIEYKKDKIYMITAVPSILDDRRIVIEIIKDITKSILFDSSEDDDIVHTGIHALIDKMNKLSFVDSLTSLYNRRYIMEKLPVDMLNSALLSTDLSVIIADIDFFKAVNDRYGHVAGDYTLKAVAEVFTGCRKRVNDWIARLGGEEFLICLPGANAEAARATAEYMRQSLEKKNISYEDKVFGVTASFGIYSLVSAGQESVDDLIKRADEKLYVAKANGRNRVEY